MFIRLALFLFISFILKGINATSICYYEFYTGTNCAGNVPDTFTITDCCVGENSDQTIINGNPISSIHIDVASGYNCYYFDGDYS